MTYAKQTWHDDDPNTPLNATRLTYLEQGIFDAHTAASVGISGETQSALDLKASISSLSSHTGNTSNPHLVTKAQVGLGNVDNTNDANKPISTAAQTALDLKVSEGDFALNLKDYGAIGNGTANDTAAVASWLTAIGSIGKPGYVPAGTYMITPDTLVAAFSGAVIYGDGDRKSIFKARSAGTRVLDFRTSSLCSLSDFAVDGNSLAATGLDLGTTTVGASTGNYLHRVRPLNQTNIGIDVSNNGDTVLDCIHGGPWPDTATGIYWPNSGGNNLLVNPKLFPASASPGPARASVEASFQNMDVQGGALMGLRVLDSSSSQTLRVAGVQFYAIKDGGNIIGPMAGNGLYALEISGATKLAVVTATQSYFDGQFQFGILARASTFNSGVTTGTANAFGASFAGSNGTTKLLLDFKGCVLRNEAGATIAIWNDTISANIERNYQKFFGLASPDKVDILRMGDGATTGQGLVVGGGVVIKKMDSTTFTWDAPSIPANSFTSTTFTWTGVVPGQWIGVGSATDLGDGIQAYAAITVSGTVRLTIHNLTAVAVDLASTTFRFYRTQIV